MKTSMERTFMEHNGISVHSVLIRMMTNIPVLNFLTSDRRKENLINIPKTNICNQTKIFERSALLIISKIKTYKPNIMKPTLAADEMFPEGAGYMDMEEVNIGLVWALNWARICAFFLFSPAVLLQFLWIWLQMKSMSMPISTTISTIYLMMEMTIFSSLTKMPTNQ